MGRTLVGRWRWGGPWWGGGGGADPGGEVEVGRTLGWGGGGGADPGGEVEVGAGVTRGGVGISLIPTSRYPHPLIETNH